MGLLFKRTVSVARRSGRVDAAPQRRNCDCGREFVSETEKVAGRAAGFLHRGADEYFTALPPRSVPASWASGLAKPKSMTSTSP